VVAADGRGAGAAQAAAGGERGHRSIVRSSASATQLCCKIVGGELAGDETVPWCSGRSSGAVCGRHRLRPPACI
jgi:hypothetical protein